MKRTLVMLLSVMMLSGAAFAQRVQVNNGAKKIPAGEASMSKAFVDLAVNMLDQKYLEKVYAEIQKNDLAGIKEEHRQRVIDAVRADAPEALNIVNLGVIAVESRGEDIAMNNDQYYSYTDATVYYVRVLQKDKAVYYAVEIRDEQRASLTKTEKILFKHDAAQGVAVKNVKEERAHVAALGARFAQLAGTDKVKQQLMVFAERYPLSSVEDFVNCKVLRAGQEKSSSFEVALGVKLAGGNIETMKLQIEPNHGTNYWWVNAYSVREIK